MLLWYGTANPECPFWPPMTAVRGSFTQWANRRFRLRVMRYMPNTDGVGPDGTDSPGRCLISLHGGNRGEVQHGQMCDELWGFGVGVADESRGTAKFSTV